MAKTEKKQEVLPLADCFLQQSKRVPKTAVLPKRKAEQGAKLAVLFPGTGYSCERPLLYFARRVAEQNGCDVLPLSYTVSLGRDVKNLGKNVEQCLPQALAYTERVLGELLCRQTYSELFFFSKSFGTVVAGKLEQQLGRRVHQFFLTPLEPTILYLKAHPCYVSCGTADPWVPDAVRREFASATGVRLGLFPGANHSLEIPGDAAASIRNLQLVAASYEEFLREKP